MVGSGKFRGRSLKPKILRPTHLKLRPAHFSGTKDIKADIFSALINIKADLLKVNNNAEKGQKPDKY
jgi:hypothetical protein